ncbi:MAG TPA: hypothetical protein VJ760_09945 [Nitrospiraceae bacterium]|nr:hypothetical protein [Nitrospiraceae bacterium]
MGTSEAGGETGKQRYRLMKEVSTRDMPVRRYRSYDKFRIALFCHRKQGACYNRPCVLTPTLTDLSGTVESEQ